MTKPLGVFAVDALMKALASASAVARSEQTKSAISELTDMVP